MQSGFTLVEIMVVVVVLSILAVVIVPQFGGSYDEAVLRAEARSLVNAVRLASSQAVTRNAAHRLRIEPTRHRYWIEARNEDRRFERIPGTEGELDGRITVRVAPRRPEEGEAPPRPVAADDRLGRPPGVIEFSPDGTADGREILLKDGTGFRLLLEVNPITARIRLTELGKEGA